MLIKPLRLTIKILIPLILSGLLLVLIAQFINLNEWFNQLNNFLKTHNFFFLFFRIFVYGLGFCLWPFLIRCSIADHQSQTPEKMKTMISARNYLLAAILIQELLYCWR
jgi:hypothetical protein